MGKYSATDTSRVTATTVDGVIAFTTATGDEGEIVEVIMTGSGSDAATDVMHRATFDVSEGGTEAIGTVQAPEPFSQLMAASGMASVEVTITTEQVTIQTPPLLQFGFNARGGMRWAVPRGEGIMLRFDATNEDASLRVLSSAADNVDANVHWWEP